MKAMHKINSGTDLNNRLSRAGNMKLGSRQAGGIYSTLLIATMFGMVLLTGLKLAPSYIDNITIVNTIETIDENEGLSNMTVAQIRTSLSRTLITNGIRDFVTASVQEVREGDDVYLDVIYEKRIPIFSNVDAVLTFNERFEK